MLSYAEANRYFNVTYDNRNNSQSRVQPTAYAIKQVAFREKTSEGSAVGYWWLRSPGKEQGSAATVSIYGDLGFQRFFADEVCVRPAFWLDLTSDIF